MKEVPQHMEREELDAYMPHKKSMYLLSRVLEHDVLESKITCETDISKDMIFFDDDENGVPNWVSFELIAQSISALTGISNVSKDREPLPGMILSVSDFAASRDYFREGETVRLHAERDFFDPETLLYRYICSASLNGEEVISMKLTVMEVEDFESIIASQQ